MFFFNLLLKIDIIIGSCREESSKVSRKYYFHNVNLFYHNSIRFELIIQFNLKALSQLSFYVSNFHHLYVFNEISYSLIYFFWKQFFKTIWSEVVEKFFGILFECFGWPTKMKVNTTIQGYHHIVFRRNTQNRGIKSNCVSRKHNNNLFPIWIATVHSRF